MKIGTLLGMVSLLWHELGKSPIVETPLGKIEGVRSELNDKPVKMFLGVPYAKPPVGSLRFLKPQPVEVWDDVLQAKTHPPACMQYSELPYPWYDNMPDKSEDCLYLNIYTPFFASYESKFAVLFWVHGGGMTFGSNRMDVYDGQALAAKEGVIVVTSNYRLGALGYFTTNTPDAPGNQGYYDAVMALQWVKDNIQYFGGDPDRITLMGESGGAQVVSLMCVSPLTKGLFSRAIVQSANIVKHIYNNLNGNMALGERLAEAVNCSRKDFTIYDHPSEVVQCMRGLNATYLTKTLWSFNPQTTASFSPQYGDELLPHNAPDEIRKGKFHNVPLLIGNVEHEGTFFLTYVRRKEFGFFGKKNQTVDKAFATKLLRDTFANHTNPQKYIDFYLNNVGNNDYVLLRERLSAALGDKYILCPVFFFAESYAERNNDVYFYDFTHRPSTTPWAEWMGVVHYEEMQFVFGRPSRMPMEYTTEEVWLSEQVMKLWANFAKDGYPSVYPKWPKYTKANHTYLKIGIDNFGQLGTGPHLPNCDLMRDYYGF